MSTDERARHELYGRLEEVLGSEHATVLMEHLPAPFANLATRDDLRGESALLRAELTALFRKELGDAISAQTRTIVLALFGAMAASSSLAFAAARLV